MARGDTEKAGEGVDGGDVVAAKRGDGDGAGADLGEDLDGIGTERRVESVDGDQPVVEGEAERVLPKVR